MKIKFMPYLAPLTLIKLGPQLTTMRLIIEPIYNYNFYIYNT